MEQKNHSQKLKFFAGWHPLAEFLAKPLQLTERTHHSHTSYFMIVSTVLQYPLVLRHKK
jgi:hypothetical protein